MKAYVVLSGGGVKGAALVGCLEAAAKLNIEIEGYAGVSAGALVALLAAAGCTIEELKDFALNRLAFEEILDDGGKRLTSIRTLRERLSKAREFFATLTSKPLPAYAVWRWIPLIQEASEFAKMFAPDFELLRTLGSNLGLYSTKGLRERVRKIVCEKLGKHEHDRIHARDLKKPIKIVITNLRARRADIIPDDADVDIVDAAVASCAFPFVFQPLSLLADDRAVVDGGLSSNLPVFLFIDECRRRRFPLIAFDLLPGQSGDSRDALNQFCRDVASTAVEASDSLHRRALEHITRRTIYVPVRMPNVEAFDVGIGKDMREALLKNGHDDATKHLKASQIIQNRDRIQQAAAGQAQRVQLLHVYWGQPRYYQPILEAVARWFESTTTAKGVRANIMLPVGDKEERRIIVYHHGMNGHSDEHLMLESDGGCSGRALTGTTGIAIGDLDNGKSEYYANWNMTDEQVGKIEKDRRSVISVAIPGWSDPLDSDGAGYAIRERVGVLNIDSSSLFSETGWTLDGRQVRLEIVEQLQGWGRLLARLLS